MNCRRTSTLLSAYIDRELTGHEMLLIRDHLSSCRACGEEYESLRLLKQLLGALPQQEGDPAWAASLTQAAIDGNPSHPGTACGS